MQVGLAEMKPVVDMTGGVVVQTDTFHNPVFKESLKRMFVAPGPEVSSLETASNATFEVRPHTHSPTGLFEQQDHNCQAGDLCLKVCCLWLSLH